MSTLAEETRRHFFLKGQRNEKKNPLMRLHVADKNQCSRLLLLVWRSNRGMWC